MASAGVDVAHSAFDALRLGRSGQCITGRLLSFWDSKNIKEHGEFMGITLLLLDKKESVIHGFIPAARSPFYCELLKEGSVVRVSRFEVAKNTNTYRLTDHPFMIRFIPQTSIDEVLENAPVVNTEISTGTRTFTVSGISPLSHSQEITSFNVTTGEASTSVSTT